MERQEETRRREQEVRERAVAMNRCLSNKPMSGAKAAGCIRIDETTLARWDREAKARRLAPRQRGRPEERADPETRDAILNTLWKMGRSTGMPTMEGLFPHVAKRELESFIARYRRQWDDGRIPRELEWTCPRFVWAMDYIHVPPLKHSGFRDALNIRDLASGRVLASAPVPVETAAHTAQILQALFLEHGAPLVIKADNGGPLVAPAVQAVLDRWQVHLLRSPVYQPQYNGSCEAGNGVIKTLAHHIAARNGREGLWTCDDLEEAVGLINSTARPWGPKGPTPDKRWAESPRPSESQRIAFDKSVREGILLGRQRQAIDASSQSRPCRKGAVSSIVSERTIIRRAIRNALVASGMLVFRRKGFPLPQVGAIS